MVDLNGFESHSRLLYRPVITREFRIAIPNTDIDTDICPGSGVDWT